ncbi:unnamed protein product [Brassicogethes aeneus]|uniref:Uncharacterized protein n=1 Tax=Brassicogethes aeneus TaxID=1431903 RepID=A0A9P0ASC0_BRAAE|nr:unnamed protein product [Brassicogethes aeneus]
MDSESEYDYEVDSVTEGKLLESDEDFLELDADITLEDNLDKPENKEDKPMLEDPKLKTNISNILEKKSQNQQEPQEQPRKRRYFVNPRQGSNHRKRFPSKNNHHRVQPWSSGVIPGTPVQGAMQVQLSSPVWVSTLPCIPVTQPMQAPLCDQITNRPNPHTYGNQYKNSYKKRYINERNPINNSGQNNTKTKINNPASSNCSSTEYQPEYKYLQLLEEQKKIREHLIRYKEQRRKFLQEIKEDPKEICSQKIHNNFIQNNDKPRLNFKQYNNFKVAKTPQNNFPNSTITTKQNAPSFSHTVQFVPNQNLNPSTPKSITVQVRNNKRYVKEEDTPPNIIITKTVKNTNHTFF